MNKVARTAAKIRNHDTRKLGWPKSLLSVSRRSRSETNPNNVKSTIEYSTMPCEKRQRDLHPALAASSGSRVERKLVALPIKVTIDPKSSNARYTSVTKELNMIPELVFLC